MSTLLSSFPAPMAGDLLSVRLRSSLLDRAHQVTRYDLGFGLGGLALLLLYRYRSLGQLTDLEDARDIAWQCVVGITSPERSCSLIELVEMAQFLHNFAAELDLEEAAQELLPVLDQLCERRMLACFAAGQADPYTGAFNPAYYLLHHDAKASRFRALWLKQLPSALDLARHTPQGKYLIPSGISHGLAFYATFVADYLQYYPQDFVFQSLAKDYLQALELRKDRQATNGCFYQDGGGSGPGRLSLAYGDCGILYAAYRLAKVLGAKEQAGKILDCLEVTAARRTRPATGITSDNLLYGRAGAWLFFHRLHTHSGRRAFADAAAYWQQGLLSGTASPRESLPLYPTYDYGAMQSFSLFEGAIGPPLTAYALATDPSFLQQLFYLR